MAQDSSLWIVVTTFSGNVPLKWTFELQLKISGFRELLKFPKKFTKPRFDCITLSGGLWNIANFMLCLGKMIGSGDLYPATGELRVYCPWKVMTLKQLNLV